MYTYTNFLCDMSTHRTMQVMHSLQSLIQCIQKNTDVHSG